MNSTSDAVPHASVFDRYAAWYDAFNRDRDYAAEAVYLLNKVSTWRPSPKSWLDIGCGTGAHLGFLQSEGLSVEGLDTSTSMIAQACVAHPNIRFHVGSAQTFQLPRNCDVISVLFHVMSYQTSDDLIRAALKNISAHLASGGVLIFDFWHTDAVLRDPPGPRVREAQIDGRTLFRITHSTEDRARHLIDVRFDFRWDSPMGALVHQESHLMRHFGADELSCFLGDAGLNVVASEGWMQNRPLGSDDWYGLMCAKKRPHGA